MGPINRLTSAVRSLMGRSEPAAVRQEPLREPAPASSLFTGPAVPQATRLSGAAASQAILTNPGFGFEREESLFGATRVIDLSGTTLEPGRPLVLETGVSRFPIDHVEVETPLGGTVEVRVGRELQSRAGSGFPAPVIGEIALEGQALLGRVRVHFADRVSLGDSDYYSFPTGKDGLKPGQALDLPIPAFRRGQPIQNINTSFLAPPRDWDEGSKRERKPTHCSWFSDGQFLSRKFVDPYPSGDLVNAPETDNIHGNDRQGLVSIATAGKKLRVVAENEHLAPDEEAMAVQWVRVTYAPAGPKPKVFDFRGHLLPNREWKGRWIGPGEKLSLEVEPSRRISRVDVQWSDKPDGQLFGQASGPSARGSLLLDGKPLGTPNEHVGSPEWQTFDNLKGARGQTLDIVTAEARLKVFEVQVFYADDPEVPR